MLVLYDILLIRTGHMHSFLSKSTLLMFY